MTSGLLCLLIVGAVMSLCYGASGDDFNKLLKRLEHLESKVTKQQETIKTLEVRLEKKCGIKHTSEQGINTRDIVEGPVAFTAAITSHTIDHVHKNQGVVFETVVTNIGEGYDNSTGVFVVPLTGIYMFHCSMLDHWAGAHGSQKLHAEIVQNGNLLVKVFAHADTSYRDQGSNTVYVHANKGDRVWVKVIDNDDLSLGGDHYSSFSGYMLWQM